MGTTCLRCSNCSTTPSSASYLRFLDSQKITMIRLYFSTVVILVALVFTPYEINAKCKKSDFTGFTYSNGKAILDQHNYLRRSVGKKDLKWSNNLEYMAWYVLKNTNNECTHSATNRFTEEIKESGKKLECPRAYDGHWENIALGRPENMAQGWIDEGPENYDGKEHGHYETMVNSDVKFVGCWHAGDCLKCIYWGNQN